jgi:signal transduction histidine kinase
MRLIFGRKRPRYFEAKEIERSLFDLIQKVLGILTEHVAILDETGRIIAINAAWRNFGDANGLRYPAQGLGSNYLTVCDGARGKCADEAAQVAASIRRLLRERHGCFSLEYPFDKPKEQRWFQVTGESFEHAFRCYAVIAHLDITIKKQAGYASLQASTAQTERVKCDQRLTEQALRLDETLKIMESLLYYIGHTLRAPLRATNGFSRLLLDQHATLDDSASHLLQRILDASQTMDGLINRVLDFGRMGMEEPACTCVELEELLEDVLISVAREYERRRPEITIAKPMPKVWGDRKILRLVLRELVTNAVKYVAPGIVPRVFILAKASGGLTRITIQDNGVGIGTENQKRIFRLFERPGFAEFYSGTGIGLVLARQGLARMGGKIGLASETAKGSSFWIELLGRV